MSIDMTQETWFSAFHSMKTTMNFDALPTADTNRRTQLNYFLQA